MIANDLDLSYQFKIFTGFSDMINAVASGSIDLAVANISITSSREKQMDFSFSIYDGGLHILVKKERLNEKSTPFEKIKNTLL